MRVCMLIPSYYPLEGGAERQLFGLLPFLRDRGIWPFVLTRRLPGTRAREQVHDVEVVRTWANSHSLAFLLSALFHLIRHRNDWDLIHVHTADSPALLGATARWLFGKPVIVKVPRSGPTAALARFQQTWRGRLRLWYLGRFVSGFVAVNREIVDSLLAAGVQKDRIFRIPNGVDIDQFHPISRSERGEIRRELDLPDAPTAIFVGRLIPRKQVERLVEIWPEVLHLVTGATLLILGHGPQQSHLEAAVQGRQLQSQIRFLGQREHQEIIRYLQASNCFVLPSSSEGLSNALLEAMATGIVPIVSHVPGNLEVIDDGKNGLVFDTAEKMCAQLVRCLSQEQLSIQLGTAARQTIVSRLSMARTASELVELYTLLLQQGKASGRQEAGAD